MDDRFSRDSQISVSISTIVGVGCKLILQLDSLVLRETIKAVGTPHYLPMIRVRRFGQQL
jgi:hypothetical protein